MIRSIEAGARRMALLVAVLVLVLAVGAVALGAADRATASQESTHRADRLQLADSLATLANGYFLELDVAQSDIAATLAPQLADVAATARTLTASLTTVAGNPLAAVETATGSLFYVTGGPGFVASLPPVESKLDALMRAGSPAVSPVFFVAGQPRVAIAVPCGDYGAELVVAYDLDTLPVAAYVQKLQIGPSAAAYVVDSAGRFVTSPDPHRIGARATPAVLAATAEAKGSQVVQVPGAPPEVVAVAPVGIGNWDLAIIQPAPIFYGSLWHSDGVFRWSLLSLVVVVAAALLVFHARRQAALQKVADMALVDPLTGLPNRLAFTRSVDAAMNLHRRGESAVALLFCDLDGFKAVNDRLGHAAGDALLVAAAERLRARVQRYERAHPALARLGGDEFTVLLHERHERSEANALATELTDAFAEPFVLGPYELSVGVSVGVAFAHPDRDLLRDADVAMYRAKAVRRSTREAGTPDRYSVAHPSVTPSGTAEGTPPEAAPGAPLRVVNGD